MNTSFSASTKFLLTSEYLVLDDVPALATPLRYNQTMISTKRDDKTISLTAYDHQGQTWYSQQRHTDTITQNDLASQCFFFLYTHGYVYGGYDLTTTIDFPRERGLGTSSTLISLLAQRAGCDPFVLYNKVCSGSGYDVACAQAQTPLLYTRHPLKMQPVTIHTTITKYLFFIYTNKKQTSHEEVQSYRTIYPDGIDGETKKIFSDLTHELITLQDITTRSRLLTTHDTLLSDILKRPRLSTILPRTQELGVIKPLGARGGDFFLLVSDKDPDYIKSTCKDHGHDVCFTWYEIYKGQSLQ